MHKNSPLSLTFLLLMLIVAISSLIAQPTAPIPLPSSHGRAFTELLTNPGFDTDTDGDKIPDGWTGKNTSVANSDKLKCDKPEEGKFFAHSAPCAFMFKGNSSGSTSKIQQTILDTSAIMDASEVTFSVYVDARNSVPEAKIGIAKIIYSDGSSAKFTLTIPAARAIENYIQIGDTQTINIPDGATITKAKVDFRYGGKTGKFLIDDAHLGVINTTSEVAKLVASDGVDDDRFGSSIAIDGDTVVVGLLTDHSDWSTDQGAAYVFVRNGTTWMQQQKLTASDAGVDDRFGASVAIDNDTIVVGSILHDIGVNDAQGAAYVFTRSGTTWTQQAKLTASDGAAGDTFGNAIAIDGDTLVVGAYNADSGITDNQGSVYVFTRSGTTWTQQAKLTASDAATDDEFGNAVALEGNTLVTGAWLHDIGTTTDQGAVYVFTRSGTTWTQQAKLTASDGAIDDLFGTSIDLNGDTLAIGVDIDDIGGNEDQGSAYIFVRNGTSWTKQAKLTVGDGAAFDGFGASIALNDDLVVVGSVGDSFGENIRQGSAYVFTRSGTTWTLQAKLAASDGERGDGFGGTVAISSTTLVVGAYGDNIDGITSQGSAYVFELAP